MPTQDEPILKVKTPQMLTRRMQVRARWWWRRHIAWHTPLSLFGSALLLSLLVAATAHRSAPDHGSEVGLTWKPEVLARQRAMLAARGVRLADTETGVVEVALSLPPAGNEAGRNGSETVAGSNRAEAPPVTMAALPPGIDPMVPPPGQPRLIAIVIDDVGPDMSAARRAIRQLPAGITLSILPYAESAATVAAEARAMNHEVMLHLPMEPTSGRTRPGPNALLLGLDDTTLAERLDWNLSRFGDYVGVNNHMGSRGTADPRLMRLILERLARDGRFFLDSRTTARSAARPIAADLGLPYGERDVFLDNDQTAAYVELQLAEAEAVARRYGSAIAIGHPHAVTISTLAAWSRDLRRRGYELVPVSRVLAARGSPWWRLARRAISSDPAKS